MTAPTTPATPSVREGVGSALDISPKAKARFLSFVKQGQIDECWPWAGRLSTHGYGVFGVYLKGRGSRNIRAHRGYWELYHGSRFPDGMFACHSCDNPACINPNHIWPGTPKQNTADMDRKGRRASRRKLSVDQVQQIVLATDPSPVLAVRFGVSAQAINAIRAGRSYSQITGIISKRRPRGEPWSGLRIKEGSKRWIAGLYS